MPTVNESIQSANEMEEALTDVIRNLVEKVVGKPSKGKGGEPLPDVCYMILPTGESIAPRDFADPWDPSDSASGEVQDDSKSGAAAGSAQGAPSSPKADTALRSARKTSEWFDRMIRVTDDGTYRIHTGGSLSKAYEGIITKAQGMPAPPLPADIQKKVDDAMHLLYVFDENGKQKGKTKEFKNYQQLKQAYSDAEAEYANAYASAMGDAALGRVWPVTSKSLRTRVQNAYDDWRSSGADTIENALETVKSVGGSIGAHFVAQARSLYEAWNLGLAGSVAVGVPYTHIMPSTWYDPLDTENGFTDITASSSKYRSNSHSQAAQAASSWYNGHRSTTGGSAGFSIGFFSVGASASHSEAEQHAGSSGSGSARSDFSKSMSNVSISLSYGLCTIFRPWLLRELFVIDGWYLPGEKANVVSDGTISGQKREDDNHLMPMIPTQFIVVRNVKISARGWGSTGDQMAQYCRNAQADSESSSTSGGGSVGIFGFGGGVSHESADWKGSDSSSSSAERSWNFEMHGDTGTLTINGCQIVGYIGEIVPSSPKLDGTAQAASTAPAGAATGGTPAAGTGTPDGGAQAGTPQAGAAPSAAPTTPAASGTAAPSGTPQGGAAPGGSSAPQ